MRPGPRTGVGDSEPRRVSVQAIYAPCSPSKACPPSSTRRRPVPTSYQVPLSGEAISYQSRSILPALSPFLTYECADRSVVSSPNRAPIVLLCDFLEPREAPLCPAHAAMLRFRTPPFLRLARSPPSFGAPTKQSGRRFAASFAGLPLRCSLPAPLLLLFSTRLCSSSPPPRPTPSCRRWRRCERAKVQVQVQGDG